MTVSAGTVKIFLDCATHPVGLVDSLKSQLTAEGVTDHSLAAGKLTASALSTLAGYAEAAARSDIANAAGTIGTWAALGLDAVSAGIELNKTGTLSNDKLLSLLADTAAVAAIAASSPVLGAGFIAAAAGLTVAAILQSDNDTSLMDATKSLAESAWQGAGQMEQDSLDAVAAGSAPVFEAIGDMMQAAGQAELDFQEAVNAGIPQILDGLNNILDAAGQAEQDSAEAMAAGVGQLFDAFAGIGQAAGQAEQDAMDALAAGTGQFFNTVKDLGQAASNALQDALNMLMTGPWQVDDDIKDLFDDFSRFPQRSDPFTLDMDGDGLETIAPKADNPILFDLNGDGIKTSVGWVKADDGFLALDRNGNGTIDNGTELFGDATPIYGPDGQVVGKAEDGFAALVQEDTNHDGVVDSQDVRWNDLRLWQDLNQDGISQEGELKTMSEAGVASINVAKTEHLAVLANGNALADLGSFTRTDGQTSTTGSVGQLADINLIQDTFHSSFSDTIPLTEQVKELPDMKGSGQVRNLREAASLSTPEGDALAGLLAQYAQATTRDQQMTLLDGILKAWAATSTMPTTFTGAYAGHELTVDMQAWYAPELTPFSPAYSEWADKLTIMERFNGRTYQPVPEGNDPVTLTLWHSPRDLLERSYEALKQSVYDDLLLQTRLKPYIGPVAFQWTGAGIELDFSWTSSPCKRDMTPPQPRQCATCWTCSVSPEPR